MRETLAAAGIVATLVCIPATVTGAGTERATSNSWLLEGGVVREQRIDRDVDRSTDGSRFPAASDHGFLYGRSDAMSVFPFDNPGTCGTDVSQDSNDPDRKKIVRKCEARWTMEFEGGVELAEDSDDRSILWMAGNLYWPLVTSLEETGIYNRYDTFGVALGLSTVGRHIEIDSDGREELEISPFVRLDCRTKNWVICDESSSTNTGLSLVAGWSPEVFASDDDFEHSRRYISVESVVSRGGASRAGRYSHEWAWRLNYDDLYGHDDSANDLDVWSAEIGYNRVLWEVGEGCIAWHLDLTAGYEDFDSRRFRGSNWYVTPSIYLACAPEARKQDGEVEMKGGGSYRYYRRGQVIRPTIP